MKNYNGMNMQMFQGMMLNNNKLAEITRPFGQF